MDEELQQTFGLTIREDSASTEADRVWEKIGLVVGHSDQNELTPERLAQLLNERANPTLGMHDVFVQFEELAKNACGPEGGNNSARLTVVIQEIKPEMLAAAIGAEENIGRRKRFLHYATDCISPAAISVLARGAATAYRKPFSLVLAVLLEKLSKSAQELTGEIRMLAEGAYRDLVKHIFDAWSASAIDVGSDYTSFFEEADDARITSEAGSVAPEPYRVLELAFETGSIGPSVWSAMARLAHTEQGERRIIDMIKNAPRTSKAANAIAQTFATTTRLAGLLNEDPVDFGAVDALLSHMPGEVGAGALLDALAEAKLRATRRGLLNRLVSFGPSITSVVTERLKGDNRWYVQRNMLTVLREAKSPIDKNLLAQFSTHADARVRREALQIMITDPVERDRVLSAALRDADVEMLKVGLRAARESMPEAVVPVLARRVVDPEFPPEFRTAALQLLARSSSVLALEALLRYAMSGTTMLGKPKLAARSAEMLTALSGLARSWPNERRAAGLLTVARESKDPDIVKAATPGRGPDIGEKDVLDVE